MMSFSIHMDKSLFKLVQIASLYSALIGCFVTQTQCLILSVNSTPEYVHPCHKSDPNINSCIKDTFNHLRPYLISGIPEIKVPSIEPMIIQRMAMENGHGPVRVRAFFNNMTILGASNYTVLSVKSDLTKYRIDFGLFIPYIEVTGNYDVNGNVLLFPVRSRGEFWAAFSNVTALAKLYGQELFKDNVTFMKTDRLGVNFKLSKSNFRIKDFLNGNNVIGEAMNLFLNQNAKEIIEEMKPAASQAIGKHFKSFLNSAFLQIPLQVWLKDASSPTPLQPQQSQPQAHFNSLPKSSSQSQSQSQSQTNAQSQTNMQAQSLSQSQPKSQPESQPQPHSLTQPKTKSKQQAESSVESS